MKLFKRIKKNIFIRLNNKLYKYKYKDAHPGTIEWFIRTEILYGGLQTNIQRNQVSPIDKRSQEELRSGGMVGGDRMLHHGYGKYYSKYLLKYFCPGRPLNIAEVGILKGSGIAIWCDLFSDGRVLGFDIDLKHFNNNMKNLIKYGAFKKNKPEIYAFDQLLDNTKDIGEILKGDKIDICIDDGLHSEESILTTLKSMYPHLSDSFIYFIEDNRSIHEKLRMKYPDLIIDNFDLLTILYKKEGLGIST